MLPYLSESKSWYCRLDQGLVVANNVSHRSRLDAPSSCHTCRSVLLTLSSDPEGRGLQIISASNDIRVMQSVEGLQKDIYPPGWLHQNCARGYTYKPNPMNGALKIS